MAGIFWERFPSMAASPQVRSWISIQINLGLSPNTVDAYGRALEDFLLFSQNENQDLLSFKREHISRYVSYLATCPNQRTRSRVGLANATMQQRLTAVRLFYDYLIEEGIRPDNPVGRGRYTPGKSFGGQRDRGLIPKYEKLPWVPTEEQWQVIVGIVRQEGVRNRIMFALAYEAALRREELCSLETGDIDPAHRLLRIRAETTKNRRERIVPYSEATGMLYKAYLDHRRTISREQGLLFLSESPRNHGKPLTIWTWSKVVKDLANRSGIDQLTTHTTRHLRITDLARADWDIHDIAAFAGHRSIESTLRYIHLSGRDLAAKLERSMRDIHTRRLQHITGNME
ncbi:tyrosine-type recombinase/integrase [Herpetosiphon geysericola]|uniref:Integrase n=1 Tax=Herpetosiphon geysericola TaxID=70996 RepID=A0A0P6XT45_9CHLR|nr:tyrosine-type recombinase/integrase [Herpetosiphon geysericola]KPL87560.1 integrase [Herpetosiphon geysericola]